MARVFISHAHEDGRIAHDVRTRLVSSGHEVFLDEDLVDGIVVGEEWQRRLHERLRWADAVICIVTSAYVASAWCAAEVGIAQSRGSRLLPLVAEPDLTHPLLSQIQAVPLSGDSQAAWRKVQQALRQIDATGGLGWPVAVPRPAPVRRPRPAGLLRPKPGDRRTRDAPALAGGARGR